MFKQRKNKRFTYKPRFQDSEETKLKDGLESKWSEVKGTSKRSGSQLNTLVVLVVMLFSIFILYYILEGYIK
ncbi:hypothetical protein [Winogradskyella vidalii]|uniref:hypothetical protein n=1 Tax=Winogradskyella vidalii TaxID=2615024 RepID=UPI0015CE5C5A|nr:hypothetical protein [Winogradskyella vidalii]